MHPGLRKTKKQNKTKQWLKLLSPTSAVKLGALLDHLLPHMLTRDSNTAEVQAIQKIALRSVTELLTLVCVEQRVSVSVNHNLHLFL